MARLPAVRRAELDGANQAAFDELADSRAVMDGRIQGPFGVLLHSPDAALATARLGAYFRYGSGLPSRARHLAAMVVAEAFDCEYEFTVHAARAVDEGIQDAAVDDLAHGRLPIDLPPDEHRVVEFVRQVVRQHRVDDPIYDEVERMLGRKGIADLVGNVGYLMMIACTMNVFEVDVQPGIQRQLSVRRQAREPQG
jgi:4-carboxymuconolactone decarboxylase